MNDVAQQPHVAGEPAEAESQAQQSEPLFTVHSNGRIEVHRPQLQRVELQTILLNTALIISAEALRDSDALRRIEGELGEHRAPRHPGPA